MWQLRPTPREPVESGQGHPERDGAFPYETRVHVDDPTSRERLAKAIAAQLASLSPEPRPVTVVCVGSDRSTGDALGPLVGTRLARTAGAGLTVYGTLEHPVHAANLSERLAAMRRHGHDDLVVAIDACLGKAENVGTISVKPGPLRPGSGVNKTLPPVGAFHVVGVVNVGGFMEYFVLQNTRLSLVMRLADLIADSLVESVTKHWPAMAALVAVSRER